MEYRRPKWLKKQTPRSKEEKQTYDKASSLGLDPDLILGFDRWEKSQKDDATLDVLRRG